jgi:hypothetical protein
MWSSPLFVEPWPHPSPPEPTSSLGVYGNTWRREKREERREKREERREKREERRETREERREKREERREKREERREKREERREKRGEKREAFSPSCLPHPFSLSLSLPPSLSLLSPLIHEGRIEE